MVTIHILNKNIFGRKHIYAGLIWVVGNVPEFFYKFVRVRQVDCMKGFVRHFFHTQQNDSTVGICKRRVSLPNALWQTAQRFLRLNTVVLPVLL